MNLIDFHVTKILSEPEQVHADWGTYWKVLVEYWDDGGDDQQKVLTGSTEGFIKSIQPGYVGQH